MKITVNLVLAILVLSSALTTTFAQERSAGMKLPALNPKSPLAELSGNHVAIRVPDHAAAIKWYTEKLDFRLIRKWTVADQQLAYLAPANSNAFWIEILSGGKLRPKTVYKDLNKSLEEGGYHHICMDVAHVDRVISELRKRGVVILGKPFVVPAVSRKLAFFQDPWGNIIELAEVVGR